MSQVYVVDAGVLFTTWAMKIADATIVTTSSIMVEIRNRRSKLRAEIMLLLDRMRVVNPEDTYVEQTNQTATRSGDSNTLSTADTELVALALMLQNVGENVELVSTDFAVLNIASHLSIPFIDPSGKFKQMITWGMKCPACQYKSDGPSRDNECPVCGTSMKKVPLKRQKKA
ncbi:MAG: hypothetical protein ACFFE2_07980 [Candidatus Thorarchaeota archaeon]